MIAMILCPSLPQHHADMGQKRTAKTTFAMQRAGERDDCQGSSLVVASMARP